MAQRTFVVAGACALALASPSIARSDDATVLGMPIGTRGYLIPHGEIAYVTGKDPTADGNDPGIYSLRGVRLEDRGGMLGRALFFSLVGAAAQDKADRTGQTQYDTEHVKLAAGVGVDVRADGDQPVSSPQTGFQGLARAWFLLDDDRRLRLEADLQLTPYVYGERDDRAKGYELRAFVTPIRWLELGVGYGHRWAAMATTLGADNRYSGTQIVGLALAHY